MAHDFVNFPELTNAQMNLYYFQSPHKQIMENITAEVVRVLDGDSVFIRWKERTFDFSLRLADIQAPEKKRQGREESKSWLENQVLGKEVEIQINPDNRVDKWGRLLGIIVCQGININKESVDTGHAKWWAERHDGELPNMDKEMNVKAWLS